MLQLSFRLCGVRMQVVQILGGLLDQPAEGRVIRLLPRRDGELEEIWAHVSTHCSEQDPRTKKRTVKPSHIRNAEPVFDDLRTISISRLSRNGSGATHLSPAVWSEVLGEHRGRAQHPVRGALVDGIVKQVRSGLFPVVLVQQQLET